MQFSQFNRIEHIIGPGEFFTSNEDIVISTLLGSCISVTIWDSQIPVGGMNHFLLPESKIEEPLNAASTRYGIHAMEKMINEILKKGGLKKRFRAKVFGGSALLNLESNITFNIPKMNIEFAFSFLETEKIPVDSYSVGGTSPRKIYFFPHDGRVLLKNTEQRVEDLVPRDSKYAQQLREEIKNQGRLILF